MGLTIAYSIEAVFTDPEIGTKTLGFGRTGSIVRGMVDSETTGELFERSTRPTVGRLEIAVSVKRRNDLIDAHYGCLLVRAAMVPSGAGCSRSTSVSTTRGLSALGVG